MTTGDLFKALIYNPDEYMNSNDIIINNYDTIIELVKDSNYDKLKLLFRSANIYEAHFLLSSYAIKHDDKYLLMQILADSSLRFRTVYVNDVFKNNYLPQFLNMLDDVQKHLYDFDCFSHHIRDDLNALKLLLEHGYEISDYYVYMVMQHNYTNITQYIISIGYDVQNVTNTYLLSGINLETLKLLIQNGICLKKNLMFIYESFIGYNYLNCIEFLMSVQPCENLDKCLLVSCKQRLFNILKYFISVGADIHTIKGSILPGTSIEIIKFLIASGYQIDKDTMNNILIGKFFKEICINDIIYLADNGGDINYIFDNGGFVTELGNCKSIDNLKYLAKNYYELLEPKIKEILVMACSRNKCEIVKYLHDLGITFDSELLIVGCYYGHYEIVEILLGYGLNFCDLDEDFFAIVHDGLYGGNNGYENLIKSLPIIRQPIFKIGDGQLDILKLLINYNVPVINFDKIFRNNSKKFYDIDIVNYCVACGMDINMVPLEICIYYKKYDLIRWLLDCECNVYLSDGCWKVIDGNDNLKTIFKDYGHEF